MKTSYQLYSSRNFGPLPETLQMLAKAGYAQVEPFGALFANLEDAKNLAASVEAADLEMPSAHFGLDLVESDADAAIAIAKALGVQNVFVPYLEEPDRPTDAAGWRAFGARLEAAGAPLVAAGLTFGWHNHDFEFTALADGSMPIDCLFEGGPSLALEFDVAWCARAGQDPMPWIEKLGARTVCAHVKDIAPTGENLNEDGWADVGQGTMDWAGLMTALRATGCALFIMEHDNPSDDVRFATASLNYLNTV
ncbi:sugar phosphate isomerase/epimerase [Rhodobacteraceae bacterium]|nr:sugar phosphate isomerase/epimerase [Paracoccaceae bacterium]